MCISFFKYHNFVVFIFFLHVHFVDFCIFKFYFILLNAWTFLVYDRWWVEYWFVSSLREYCAEYFNILICAIFEEYFILIIAFHSLGNLFIVKDVYECIILLFYIYISLIDFEIEWNTVWIMNYENFRMNRNLCIIIFYSFRTRCCYRYNRDAFNVTCIIARNINAYRAAKPSTFTTLWLLRVLAHRARNN